jgi:hypothetical protein
MADIRTAKSITPPAGSTEDSITFCEAVVLALLILGPTDCAEVARGTLNLSVVCDRHKHDVVPGRRRLACLPPDNLQFLAHPSTVSKLFCLLNDQRK